MDWMMESLSARYVLSVYPKIGPRFRDNDMRKNKRLKRAV